MMVQKIVQSTVGHLHQYQLGTVSADPLPLTSNKFHSQHCHELHEIDKHRLLLT